MLILRNMDTGELYDLEAQPNHPVNVHTWGSGLCVVEDFVVSWFTDTNHVEYNALDCSDGGCDKLVQISKHLFIVILACMVNWDGTNAKLDEHREAIETHFKGLSVRLIP